MKFFCTAVFLILGIGLHAQTTSVLIPCHPAHFPLLEELLEAYVRQTVLPEEVVVSLSQSSSVSPEQITALEQKKWPFRLVLLKHQAKYAAGTNRRLAAYASKGELLLCQDADDLPHPQRVELVKKIFQKYPIYFLIHSFVSENRSFLSYEDSAIVASTFYFDTLISGIQKGDQTIPLHHGNVCLRRIMTQWILWGDEFAVGEDLRFSIACHQRFSSHCFATPLQLIQFRKSLSYFSNTPEELR